MRRFTTIAVAIAMLLVAGNARAEEREWVVQAGAGPLFPNTQESDLLGGMLTFGVATPLRPWCMAGVDLAWYGFDAHNWTDMFWNNWRMGHSGAFTAGVSFRLQVPVRVGPAPFVVMESGVGRAHWGERSAPYRLFSGPNWSYGTSDGVEYFLAHSVGLGVRVVAPRGWPDLELCVRKTTWAGERDRSLVEPRLTLAF